ncbi:COG4223 family protein [Maritimibacter sp. DP1N21-5]|uniref:COG4223 family protein n=1 Tax=Maritimibacter sp. DP1N21-5 TaxID=2836867 RepID=UPI001C494618|nr:hypothetical protein [Maritimibacter sp. DP1N21-5]MBV7410958.1 hypothetical protein [Maritimibacter sp. DP1N21-5]
MAKTPKPGRESDDQNSVDEGNGTESKLPDDIEDAEIVEDSAKDTEETAIPEAADTPSGLETVDPTHDDAAGRADGIADGTDTPPTAPWSKAETEDGSVEAERDSEVSPPPPVVVQQKSTGGFAGLVAGGLIAGILGFGAAQYANGGWPFGSDQDPTGDAIAQNAGRIDDLTAQLGQAESAIAALEADTSALDAGEALRGDLEAVQGSVTDLSERLDAMAGRLDALEKMAPGDSAEAAEAAAAAYERELADMRAMLDSELNTIRENQAAAEELQAQAAANAQAASARAALSRIMAALDTGQPFNESLSELTTATGEEAPQALASVASDGVPTLATLQEQFPESARAALDAALRQAVEDGTIGRGEAFFRVQFGTRSLEPKEGDDPDAILSRAEFALHNGRLDEALSEVATLPDAAQPAMAEWVDLAETRRDAIAAGSALADSLNQ